MRKILRRPFLFSIILSFFVVLAGCASESTIQEPAYDVVIYGGTSAGISAAIQVARMGKSVVVVGPTTETGPTRSTYARRDE
jgi:heterodisulfide reductase subunit A-like polyferredoxin